MSANPILSRVRRKRTLRVWHRWIGLSLAVLVIISSVTGLLLAWKKQVSWLQPKEHLGVSTNVKAWAPIALLHEVAIEALSDSLGTSIEYPLEIDRYDARPQKGIVKVLFTNHWEVQVDATTGIVYSVGKRHADWIEKLHDGSIVSDVVKRFSMTALSLGLCLLTFTGIYLWWRPTKSVKSKTR